MPVDLPRSLRHIPIPVEHRFRLGLCPVHSPLLGASLLLSFPSLSDMLKFSE